MSSSINVIFEKDKDGRLTENALLYHDFLRYGREHPNQDFRFTVMANWLMQNNTEFRDYYTDSMAHTPMSYRVAQRRRRIQGCIDNLINLKLVYTKAFVTADRNRVDIPLYAFSTEGHLLALLIEIKAVEDQYATHEDLKINTTPEATNLKNHTRKARNWLRLVDKKGPIKNMTRLNYYNDPKVSEAIKQLLDIVRSFESIQDSCSLHFVTKFLENCREKSLIVYIVGFFMDFILPSFAVKDGHDLLLLLLGIKHPLNWLLASPETFYQTLNELDEETKKIMLFEFKLEIEGYYVENYLAFEWGKSNSIQKTLQVIAATDFSGIVGIPGKEWQILRFKHSSNYSNVVIPGFCGSCKSEQPVLVDIYEYLATVIQAHRPYPSDLVSGDCPKCNTKYGVAAAAIGLPWFHSPWILLRKIKEQEIPKSKKGKLKLR